MKAHLFSFIILICFISSGTAKAEGVAILENYSSIDPDSVKSKPVSEIYHQRPSETFFEFKLRFPQGSFGDDFKPNSSSESGGMVESMEGSKGGMGAEMGYEFGLTSNFFFEKKPANFSTGLRVTYFSFSTFPFSWRTTGGYVTNDAVYTNLDFLSTKAGIVFRSAIGDKKSFEFYDQLCFAYSWNGSFIYNDNSSFYSDEVEVNIGPGTGLRNEMGATFRTGHFITDFGFSFGKISYNSILYVRNASASGYNPYNIDLDLKADMPSSTIHLMIGFVF